MLLPHPVRHQNCFSIISQSSMTNQPPLLTSLILVSSLLAHVTDTPSIPISHPPPRPTVKLSLKTPPTPNHVSATLAMPTVHPLSLPASHPVKYHVQKNGRLMWVNTVDPWSICWIKAVVDGSDCEHAHKHLHSFVHNSCIDEVDASLLADLQALSPDDAH